MLTPIFKANASVCWSKAHWWRRTDMNGWPTVPYSTTIYRTKSHRVTWNGTLVRYNETYIEDHDAVVEIS